MGADAGNRRMAANSSNEAAVTQATPGRTYWSDKAGKITR
jgi:hypothetical protein